MRFRTEPISRAGQERLDAAGFGLHRFYNLKMLLRIRTAEIVELIRAAGPIMPLSVDPLVMRERHDRPSRLNQLYNLCCPYSQKHTRL